MDDGPTDTPKHASDLGERFSLETVIAGLADDLAQLRRGEISIPDAMARAVLAKQFMQGIRLVISARQMLTVEAKRLAPPTTPPDFPTP